MIWMKKKIQKIIDSLPEPVQKHREYMASGSYDYGDIQLRYLIVLIIGAYLGTVWSIPQLIVVFIVFHLIDFAFWLAFHEKPPKERILERGMS